MQHSAQNVSGRREDRVPLVALIELRGDQAHERVAADGLNVSIGGIAMRAAYAPALGSVYECSFACPSTGELVCAQGQVVWSTQSGPEKGAFGLRFVELDTKSATALRRYLRPATERESKVDRPRSATLAIDGLGVEVQADLKLADGSRIVLEHSLDGLQLGRGVEITVPGRGKERGRIASVELRQSHFGIPTLVYGVLLDDAPERAGVSVAPPLASPIAALFTRIVGGTTAASTSTASAVADCTPSDAVGDTASAEPAAAEHGPPAVLAEEVASPPAAEDDDDEPAPTPYSFTRAAPPRSLSRTELARSAEAAARDGLHAVEPEDELDDPEYLDELSGDAHASASLDDDDLDRESSVNLGTGTDRISEVGEPCTTVASATSSVRLSSVEELPDDDDLADGEHPALLPAPPSAPLSATDEELDAELAALSDYDDDDQVEADEAPSPVRAEPASLTLRVRNLPTHLRSFFHAPVARFKTLTQRFEPALREQAEAFDLPDARTRLLLHLARVRGLMLRGWSTVRKQTAQVRARKGRPMRVQRSTLLGIGPAGEVEVPRPPQTARIAALALAVVGIGLGVYALAPRSGADRIRLPERSESVTVAEPTLEIEDDGELLDEPGTTAPATPRAAVTKRTQGGTAEPLGVDAPDLEGPATPVFSAPFGEAEVPNGRVFTLRMNGPVQVVEGEARDNGITVRIPGRLALDRASPIATSHSSVERAMILNRGGYAELTIDFKAGEAPRYQVRGKDNTLEVTLERL